jgi:hypothetical protein
MWGWGVCRRRAPWPLVDESLSGGRYKMVSERTWPSAPDGTRPLTVCAWICEDAGLEKEKYAIGLKSKVQAFAPSTLFPFLALFSLDLTRIPFRLLGVR